MFYFLDALDAPTLCRFCLVSDELRHPRGSAEPLRSSPRVPPSAAPPWLEDEPAPDAIPSTPFYDAFTEIGSALRDVAPDEPFAITARRLLTEAARRWKVGRVSEAVYIVQRLRATLVELGLASPFPTITTAGPSTPTEPLLEAPPEHIVQVLLAACTEEYDRPVSRLGAGALIAPGWA
jgi:hypothetical protein